MIQLGIMIQSNGNSRMINRVANIDLADMFMNANFM